MNLQFDGELRFNDYYSTIFEEERLGVFLYDKNILYGWNKSYGIQTYKFRVEVFPQDLNTVLPEYLEFICNCDLKDYVIKQDDILKGELWTIERLDWMKLLQTFRPELLSRTLERLNRKLNPNTNPNIDKNYLQVDNESNFGGNYEIESKQACTISFGRNDSVSIFYELNIPTDWQSYNLPHHLQKDIEQGKEKPYYNIVCKWSRTQKQEFFKSLSLENKNYISVSVLERTLQHFKDKHYYPYEVYIAGNDDESWTKYFATEEEMIQEVNYLRMMEPINKNLDICSRDYVFTN